MSEADRAELIEWQSRCVDLSNSVERLREERDHARTTAALLEAETARLEREVHALTAFVDRLRIAITQGAEL